MFELMETIPLSRLEEFCPPQLDIRFLSKRSEVVHIKGMGTRFSYLASVSFLSGKFSTAISDSFNC